MNTKFIQLTQAKGVFVQLGYEQGRKPRSISTILDRSMNMINRKAARDARNDTAHLRTRRGNPHTVGGCRTIQSRRRRDILATWCR